jgi:LuxR family transcriptional regulator, maltose regulon positive regulatory protein
MRAAKKGRLSDPVGEHLFFTSRRHIIIHRCRWGQKRGKEPMPKRAQYVLSWSSERDDYLLSGPQHATPPSSSLQEGGAWLEWLEAHRAFAFHGRSGQVNLLKEKRSRGGEGYWYAYRRQAGGMVKRYAGRSAQLGVERLEELAATLEGAETAQQMQAATPPASPVQFEPLLMPKLQLPRPQRSLLPREHLLELLDRGLELKLTLIAGPAGYGKTTLVGQWIAERRARRDFPPVACVTLDEGDNDPIRFWRYIIAACQKFRADLGGEALELLLAHRLPPFKPLEMMLTALLNELSQLEHPCILLLDDVHLISSQQVSDTLSFFIDHLPNSLHLVMLIRGDPAFSVARLRARNELLDIYPPNLGFSLEETRAFLEQELVFALSPQALRQVCALLEGWPTGLRMLARVLQSTGGSEQEIEQVLAAFASSHWSFQDYFLNEVLHRLAPEQQEFLLQTSVLPRVTASLCDAITGRVDSERLIEALRGGDLFLIPLDGTGEWARYHPLFADAMRQEARRRLGDERLRRLAAGASAWYEVRGLMDEAIETALDAADFAHAAALIERGIESKRLGSAPTVPDFYSLRRWLERLPAQELERSPELCLNYALALLFTTGASSRFADEQERVCRLLNAAEQKWRDANNTAKLAEVFAFRALLTRQEGKMLEAVTWARQSLAWLPRAERTWRNLDLTVVGIGELLDGNLDNAREYLLEARILSEQQGNLTYARATWGMLSWAAFEQGELLYTAEQFRQLQIEARQHEDRDDIARSQLGLAQISYQWNNLAETEQGAHEALQIGRQMNAEEIQARATVLLALIECARGQNAQARRRLTACLARGERSSSLHSYQLYREVQAALARIQLAGGDLASVRRWFAAIARRAETLPLLQRQREQLLRARLQLAQREIPAAIENMESLSTAALQTGHISFELEVQVALTLAYSRAGSNEQARELLRELLETTRSEGYVRLFLDEGEELAELLRGLLPNLREKALQSYARRLLDAFALESGAVATQAAETAALLLEPLSPQEHKVLRLLAAGNSNAMIAGELTVSVNTVRTQLQSIYRKLDVTNRFEASAVARRLGLV